MQNRNFKILIFLFLGLISFLETAYSQGFKEELKTADSLFQQKRYTQSLTLYEKIAREEQQASPAMLLKMAFIYESLEDLSNALYALNSYYMLTSDKKVLTKMTELAQTHSLEGYSTNDFDLFLKFYDEHRNYFILITLALGILILSMIFKRKKKLNERSIGLSFGLLSIALVAFLLINFSQLAPKGIINSANTYLMTGPSAGSDLIEITGEGHKVEIVGKKDIWLEIKWKSGRAFIRENNIQRLPN
ncbi:MAG: hypothetical protein COW03_15720 [Cytophagales bacterium CG12_big_fil_rev_8_21_14_0_65_40_12]|nr:MAG: hypothetical protein COW03_15720 [Cytophagales bacterium CG12_big_fil_rev_8_21_14_0_65_40_12]PIW04801.1 MAG: hypothetical protein COW40_08000 [Cytophagales bacterium CG17_big_fil_post_rev_8_21_14_2_50_40_13]